VGVVAFIRAPLERLGSRLVLAKVRSRVKQFLALGNAGWPDGAPHSKITLPVELHVDLVVCLLEELFF